MNLSRRTRLLRTSLLLGAGLFVVILVGIIAALLGVGWFGLVLGGLVGVASMWLAMRGIDARVLRSLATRPLEPGEAPRLDNLVNGLCVTHGITPPELHLIDTESVNALAVGHSTDSTALVVTQGLLDTLGRVELEGVVARELALIKSGHTALGSTLVLVAVIQPKWAHRLLPTRSDVVADIEAVGLTRYPPGLLGALSHMDGQARVLDAPRWTWHLWVADPAADAAGRVDSFHSSFEERVATLQEL